MNIKAILSLASVALLLVTIYEQNKAINEKKDQIIELKNQNTSLRDSIFNTNVELGRYELTLEYLKEANSKAAKQFEDYMSHETE
jgi:hypothetical protein